MNFRKILACLSAVILVFSLLTVTALASSGNVSVSITASPAEARPGQEVTLTFTVHNDTNKGLGGLEFTVTVPDGFTATGEATSTAKSAGNAAYTGNKFTFSSTEVGTTGFTDKTWDALVLKATADKKTIGDQTFSLTISDASDGDNGDVSFQETSECKVKVVHTAAGDHTETTEHTKLPNCTEQGTDTVKCSVCGATLRTTSVDALGHQSLTIGDFSWSVASDNTSATATAHVTCDRDGCKYKSGMDEKVTVTGPFTEDASCDKPGTVTFKGTITIDGETKTGEKSVEVEKLPHTWEPSFQWSDDHKSATASRTCSVCKTKEDASSVSIKEEGTPATCEEDSTVTWTATATFSDGTTATSKTEKDSTKALGHKWGEPVFTWDTTKEPYSATAAHSCERGDAKDVAVEGVKVTFVTEDATCTKAGETAYTAKVTVDGKEYSDEAKKAIPALGHEFPEPAEDTVTVTWAEDNSSATASRQCVRCDEKDEATVKPTEKYVPATYLKPDVTTYTATFEFTKEKAGTFEATKEVKGTELLEPTFSGDVKNSADGVTVDAQAADTVESCAEDLISAALAGPRPAGMSEELYDELRKAGATNGPLEVTTVLDIQDAANKPADAVAAWDIQIAVMVNGEPAGNITQVDSPIKINFTVPADAAPGPIYYVDCDHSDGANERISPTVTTAANDMQFSFSTAKFSTFTLFSSNDLKDAEISGVEPSYTYTGKAIEPAVKVTINGGNETLKESTDYTVEYSGNDKPGTATVTIKGIGNYTGEVKLTFEIAAPTPTATANAPAATKAPSAPGTGDETPVALFAVVLTACAAVLGVVLFLVRRRQQQK